MGISWLQIIVGAGCAFALSFLLHTVDVDRLERSKETAIALQKAADADSCADDKAITKEINDANQKDDTDITLERNRAERLQPSACIVVPTSQQANAGTGKAGRTETHGTTISAFRDYAADYKRCQTELKNMWGFVDKTWAKNGQ